MTKFVITETLSNSVIFKTVMVSFIEEGLYTVFQKKFTPRTFMITV